MVRTKANKQDKMIGKLCRQLRRLRELEQGEIAGKLSNPVSQATMSYWEAGLVPIPRQSLEELAGFYNVPFSQLATGKGEFFKTKYQD